MALSKQSRNIIIGGVVAVIVIAALAFLIGRGCGGEETTTTPTTPTSTRTATTQPPVTVTVETPTTPEPTPTATVVTVLPEILNRSVNPEVADPGDSLTFSADVNGPADTVTMTIKKQDTGDIAFTLPLIAGAIVGDTTAWSNTAAAPATKGVYSYFASAMATDGTIVEMPGVSGYTFCVGDPMVDCS